MTYVRIPTVKEACELDPGALDFALSEQVEHLSDLLDEVEGSAADFFGRNHVTQGMARLLREGLQRLAGSSSQAVFELRQAMGGGKTHTMLALGLLARNPHLYDHVPATVTQGIAGAKAKVVAINGRTVSPDHFLWGDIATQLGKFETFSKFWKDGADAPREDDWIKLIGDEPTLILLDELPPYIEFAKTRPVGGATLAEVTTFALSNLLSAAMKLKRTAIVVSNLTGSYQGATQALAATLKNIAEETKRQALPITPVVDDTMELGQIISVGDDFQTRPMRGGMALWDLLSRDADVNLPGELGQEMAAWLGRAGLYLDEDEWPPGAEDTMVAIGEAAPVSNPDVAWVHHKIRAAIPSACITLGDAQVLDTVTAAGSASVRFMGDDGSRRKFWREAIILEGDDAASLRRHAANAYPDLHFVEGALNGLSDLSGGYLAARHKVRKAFATLNDFGAWVFTWPPPAVAHGEAQPPDLALRPTNQLIQIRFTGLGLDVAPEKPNVRNDRVCRTAREITFGGRTLYCHWHVRLDPHRNRTHIHEPVPENGGKLVVGMIAEHLPLPA